MHAAADEQEAGEVAVEHDRAGDDVEAEVALVDDAAAAGARRPSVRSLSRVTLTDSLQRRKPSLREERQAAEVVVGRDDLALGVVEDVALGVGEGELHPPPLADDVLQHLDRVELLVWPKIDHRISDAGWRVAGLFRRARSNIARTKWGRMIWNRTGEGAVQACMKRPIVVAVGGLLIGLGWLIHIAPGVVLHQRQRSWGVQIEQGDLLFQDLDCGERCELIRTVTQSRYTHVGMVLREGDELVVWEAQWGSPYRSNTNRLASRFDEVTIGRASRG